MVDTPLRSKIKNLYIYSQNVQQKFNWVSTLLEERKSSTNILFLQEPPWRKIRYSASMTDKRGESVIGPPLHLDWICVYLTGFADHVEARPRVMTYVNRQLKSLRPVFKTDVVRHRDIMLLSLQTPFGEWNMLNVYSDPEESSAIRYLADCVADLHDIGCM